MKKYTLLFGLILSFSSTILNAQEQYNKLSIGASIGGHDGMAPTAGHTKLYQIHHFSGNVRYMLNNRVGIMTELGYDFFDFYNLGGTNTNYIRTSINGVVNAGEILNFSSFCNKAGLLIHGGAGMSFMWSNTIKSENPSDPFLKNADDMVNWTFGVTPQYKLTERIALNADLSFIFHTRQNHTFDFRYPTRRSGINGYFINMSVGVSYALGKNKEHADWIPTVYGEADNSSFETRVKELEDKAKDDDQDGVPNYVDSEANTPKGSYVSSKGEALKSNDRDADGITDEYDACPDVKGTFSMNGCLDSDNDGLSDIKDACPTVAGTAVNKGCPEISKETKEILNRALKGVQFETAKDVILPSSYSILNEVVDVMLKNPDYKLSIEGHTDNVGDDNTNLVLSEKRAQAVKNYLTTKGLSSTRMNAAGFGETRPKALNETEDGKAINRRVEFNIVF